MPSPLPRLRKLCLALPEAHEVEAWGEPTFRVKGKMFAMYAADGNHHGSGRASVWVKSDKENQALMLSTQPDRYFKPPYVGPSGWVGVYLDNSPDWDEVAEVVRDGWKMIAPKRVIAAQSAIGAPSAIGAQSAKRKAPRGGTKRAIKARGANSKARKGRKRATG